MGRPLFHRHFTNSRHGSPRTSDDKMQYSGNNILANVYTVPFHLMQFKHSMIYGGVGVSRGVHSQLYADEVNFFRPEHLYIHFSRMTCRTKIRMVHSNSMCRYTIFLGDVNPQDPNRFVRDESQNRRNVHVHRMIYNGHFCNLQGDGGNPNEG